MRNEIVSFRKGVVNVARKAGMKVAAVGSAVGGALASGVAMAQDSLGAAAQAEVAGVKADVSSILMVLVGVVFLLVAWSYFKRAK